MIHIFLLCTLICTSTLVLSVPESPQSATQRQTTIWGRNKARMLNRLESQQEQQKEALNYRAEKRRNKSGMVMKGILQVIGGLSLAILAPYSVYLIDLALFGPMLCTGLICAILAVDVVATIGGIALIYYGVHRLYHACKAEPLESPEALALVATPIN